MYCTNCGSEIPTGAKFCVKCGKKINSGTKTNTRESRQEFSGKIFKCPNCGEILKSFEAVCPACGLELREVSPSTAVKTFSRKLEAIEAQRKPSTPSKSTLLRREFYEISDVDEQKISLIKNFAIPNTIEDITEFMILATTNIDVKMYDSYKLTNAAYRATAEAWCAKIIQAYEKAEQSYSEEEEFSDIQRMYNSCMKRIKFQEKKGIIKKIIAYGWAPAVIIIMAVVILIYTPINNKREDERMLEIVAEIENLVEDGEYKYALMNAEDLVYDGSDSEKERKWDIERERWIDTIIEKAEQEGIILERPTEEPTEESTKSTTLDETTDDNPRGFVNGFIEGVKSGFDDNN